MRSGIRLLMFFILVGASSASLAQAVLSGAQTGTIHAVAQDDGYVTISGRNYNFDHAITKIYIADEEVKSTLLFEGMVVRFTVNRENVVNRIDIIGPASKIKEAMPDS